MCFLVHHLLCPIIYMVDCKLAVSLVIQILCWSLKSDHKKHGSSTKEISLFVVRMCDEYLKRVQMKSIPKVMYPYGGLLQLTDSCHQAYLVT